MSKKLNILIVRFSSIGDIILTTPVVRCIKDQTGGDIDFLTKSKYKELLVNNPNIREVLTVSNFSQTIKLLKSRKYDCVIDLQNNLRSLKIRVLLGIKSYTFSKENVKRYLLIYFGINLLGNHTVDRYFTSVENLNVYNDKKGLDYFINSDKLNIDFNIKQDYICWCIGGTYEQKRLSAMQIANVISKINLPVLFLGGSEEKKLSREIVKNGKCKNVFDFCGETSFEESAYLMQKSRLVLTNDTGMMHIAAAFDVPIISFWGCTKPSLGFYPYQANVKSETIIAGFSERPCSKHGKYCRFQSAGCIKEIDEDIILNTVESLLK